LKALFSKNIVIVPAMMLKELARFMTVCLLLPPAAASASSLMPSSLSYFCLIFVDSVVVAVPEMETWR
jgi:hypothetical protein